MIQQYENSTTTYEAVIADGLLSVTPNCADLMRGVFEHDGINCSTDDGRLHFHRGGSVLVPDGDCEVSQFPAGFATRICGKIRSLGHEVTVYDRREIPSLTENQEREDQLAFDSIYEGLLETLQAQPTGLIECPRGPGRNSMIASLCQVLEGERFLIIVSTVERAREIMAALFHRNVRHTALVRGNAAVPDSRVIIGTFATLRYARAPEFSILLHEDADEASARENAEILRYEWGNRRVYAFRGSEPSSRRTLLTHEGMFGSRLYPVRELMESANATILLADYSTPPRRLPDDAQSQSEAICDCRERNLAVVGIVNQWVTSDLREIDPGTAVLRLPQWYDSEPGGRDAIVVAGSRQHAASLLALFHRETEMVVSGDRDDHVFTIRSGGTIRITTPNSWLLMRSANVDLVVIASGGTHPGLSASTLSTDRRILVVDFCDHWHPALLQKTLSRVAQYKRQGYDVDTRGVAAPVLPEHPRSLRRSRRRRQRAR